MISMDRPTSGHDLIFFPYFSSILFFFFVSCCFLFPLFFFWKFQSFTIIATCMRNESNRTEPGEKGTKGKGNRETNKRAYIACDGCCLWGFVFPPHERRLMCFVDDDDDDEARRQSDLSTFLDLIFCSSALGMKKRKTCECGGVW